MGKFLLISVWPIATITTLFASIFLIFFLPITLGQVKGASTANDVELRPNYQLFTALPQDTNFIEENATIQDARVEIVRQFLDRYSSPLAPYAKLLVETAETYHLDFRLLPAVAMQESTLCKKIPEDSYNCWGYGIYGDNVLRFDSYEEAIENVGKGLSVDYIHDGLSTPELIMDRYTPSSDGSWAVSVRSFMEKMD